MSTVEQSSAGTVSMGMSSIMRRVMSFVGMAETLGSMNVMTGIESTLTGVTSIAFRSNRERR